MSRKNVVPPRLTRLTLPLVLVATALFLASAKREMQQLGIGLVFLVNEQQPHQRRELMGMNSLWEQTLSIATNGTVHEKRGHCDTILVQLDSQRRERSNSSMSPLDCMLMKAVCGVPSCEATIDLVYTWVNGSDPKLIAKKQAAVAYMEKSGTKETFSTKLWKASTSSSRFQSFDELKYSLRSVERNAPWARRIYLVTNDQVPSFLHPDESLRLRMVSHRDLFSHVNVTAPQYSLFNSMAIQSMLHAIPTISSPFLMLDDDMMFTSKIPKSYLMNETSKKYILWLKNGNIGRNKHHPYISSMWKAVDTFATKYPNATIARNSIKRRRFPWTAHGPMLLFPEIGFQLWRDFGDLLEQQLHIPFRNPNSFLMQAFFSLYGRAENWYATRVVNETVFRKIQLKSGSYKSVLQNLLDDPSRPYVICMNDDFYSDNDDMIRQAAAAIDSVFSQIIPEKLMA